MGETSRVNVAITVDFDAETVWLGQGNESIAWVARGAYGANEGVHRVLRLLDAHDVPSTFFIPAWVAENHTKQVREVVAAGHEIGHHGYLHEPPTALNPDQERAVMEKGLEILEDVTGQRPRGYRAPLLEVSPATLDLVSEYGFEYDASLCAWDRPYWVEPAGGGQRLVEIPNRADLIDTAYFLFGPFGPHLVQGLRPPTQVLEIWTDDFDRGYAEGDGYTYVITVHPQFIGPPHRIGVLEGLIRHIRSYGDVEFVQLGMMARAFRDAQAS